MKRIASCLLLATLILFLTACVKDNHSVRFRNNFSETVENIVAGTAHLGTLHPGETSGYVSISSGNFAISGTSYSGRTLVGSGTITGKGTHQWTIILNASGQLSMVNDK